MVLSAAQESLRRGLPWAKVARVAVDALRLAVAGGMTGRSLPLPGDVQAAEERAVEPLVEAMGTPRAEAKRHVAVAKRVEDEGRFGSRNRPQCTDADGFLSVRAGVLRRGLVAE